MTTDSSSALNSPPPDPGNSPPEEWTEDIDPAKVQEIIARLQGESGDA